jgi:AcrR family transcriptional regulator
MGSTRERLIEGALEAMRTQGIAGVSARTIAAAAGVNQALVFYHFGSVDELLAQASRASNERRVSAYRERLAAVGSLRELLDLGRALHAEERALGNVAVMAQMLAGAQNGGNLAGPTAESLNTWITEIEAVLTRLLAGSPVAEIADPSGLARAVSAAFVGLELYEGVDPQGAASAMDALEQLAVLLEVVDDLGPVARRALRSRLTRRSTPAARRSTPAGRRA